MLLTLPHDFGCITASPTPPQLGAAPWAGTRTKGYFPSRAGTFFLSREVNLILVCSHCVPVILSFLAVQWSRFKRRGVDVVYSHIYPATLELGNSLGIWVERRLNFLTAKGCIDSRLSFFWAGTITNRQFMIEEYLCFPWRYLSARTKKKSLLQGACFLWLEGHRFPSRWLYLSTSMIGSTPNFIGLWLHDGVESQWNSNRIRYPCHSIEHSRPGTNFEM